MNFKSRLKNHSYIGLLAGALICTPLVATAQEGSDDTAAAEDEEVVLGNVVVTARKQDERLLDAPVAVSVLTDQFFENTGINTITDLVRSVPGFDYSPTNTTRAQGTAIRGISTFSFSDGFESSVATVIDGVVMGREAQGFFDLYDIDSFEVIKGPQGTLFGKNASAGVVNIRTKGPEFEFGGGGDIMFGTDNEFRLRGSITGPIIEDVLAFRLTGSTNTHDGRLENRLAGEDDVNDKDTWALRGKLLFTPSENFSALLTVDAVEEDNACCLPTYRVAGDPSPVFAFLALNPGVLQLQDALSDAGIVAGPGNRAVAVQYDRISQESESSGAALELTYDFGNVELTSITSIRDWEIDEFNEADQLSASNVNNRNGTQSDSEQFTQEFRLTGSVNDSLSYVGGLFYFDEDLSADGSVFVELALPFPPFFNSQNRAQRTVSTESFALFGEATLDVTDRFSLIGGLRYTDEEKSATYTRTATPIIGALPVGSVFGPDVTGAVTVDDTNWSGRVIAKYALADDANAYLTWSRGYKGAGIDVAESVNVNAITVPGELPVLEPEIPTLVELGFKGQFFDDTLLLNTAVFHQSIEGLQAITNSVVTNSIVNLSIEEVISKGVEADITYLPPILDGLTLTSSVTYLDVKYEEFSDNPALEGEDYRNVPEWALSLDADYRFDLGNSGWQGFARAEYFWQDEKNTTTDGATDFDIDSYSQINLRAGATSPNDKYSVTLAIENAGDEDYPYFIGGSSYRSIDGTTTTQFLAPGQLVRLTLGAKF